MFGWCIYTPMQTCECGVVCTNKFNLDRHVLTRSHELNMLTGETLVMNSSGFYECDVCNYYSGKRDHFRKHVLSAKHVAARERQSAEVNVNMDMTDRNFSPVSPNVVNVEATPAVATLATAATSLENVMIQPVKLGEVIEMFLNFMKSEKDSQNIQQTEIFKTFADRILAHQSQQTAHSHNNTTNNNTTNNSNNTKKKFNLNLFLNEECKNAMNLTDFIQGLVVNMEDLEHICELGYTQGMSKIISKAMNGTRKTERPIHCSDSKRETMYVRKDDTWHKDANKEECERLIKHIGSKNMKFMSKWCEDNPGYQISDSPEYEKWYSITRALCNTDPKAMRKLIHHLALATEIEKDDDFDSDDDDMS